MTVLINASIDSTNDIKDTLIELQSECESNIEDLQDKIAEIENDLENDDLPEDEAQNLQDQIDNLNDELTNWEKDLENVEAWLSDIECYSNGDDLIHENDFYDHLDCLIEDIYEIPDNLKTYIDYESLKRDLKMDYTEINIDGGGR